MKEFKYKLGSKVKDSITGFTGIVRVRSQYLTGCNNYGVQPISLKSDGSMSKWEYFDEDLLTQVGKKVLLEDRSKDKGGPMASDHYPPQS